MLADSSQPGIPSVSKSWGYSGQNYWCACYASPHVVARVLILIQVHELSCAHGSLKVIALLSEEREREHISRQGGSQRCM